MNAPSPFPLRPDRDASTSANSRRAFVRAITAMALTVPAARGRCRPAETRLAAMTCRRPDAQGGGFADLDQQLSDPHHRHDACRRSLRNRPRSGYSRSAVQVDLGGVAKVRVPYAATQPQPGFVGEGAAAPLAQFTLGRGRRSGRPQAPDPVRGDRRAGQCDARNARRNHRPLLAVATAQVPRRCGVRHCRRRSTAGRAAEWRDADHRHGWRRARCPGRAILATSPARSADAGINADDMVIVASRERHEVPAAGLAGLHQPVLGPADCGRHRDRDRAGRLGSAIRACRTSRPDRGHGHFEDTTPLPISTAGRLYRRGADAIGVSAGLDHHQGSRPLCLGGAAGCGAGGQFGHLVTPWTVGA